MPDSHNQIIGVPEKINKMFSSIAHRYDTTNTVLSLGIHHLWKKKLANRLNYLKNQSNARVLDLCTGTGDVLELIALKQIDCVGVDFCDEMLFQGRDRKANGKKLNFLKADALNLPFEEKTFDAVTIAFGIRNIPDLTRALNEIKRVLKPSGRIVILEFGKMEFPVLGNIYNLYAKYIMPLIGGLLTGNKEAYTYLPETSQKFPSKQNFNQKLIECGFSVKPYQVLSFGIGYIYEAEAIK